MSPRRTQSICPPRLAYDVNGRNEVRVRFPDFTTFVRFVLQLPVG